jgi:flagellar assembly protein FliH
VAAAAPVAESPDEHSRLAALERDAFAKGYAQGERAGAEAAAKRGDAMLRRLSDTLEELTMLRAEMMRQSERQLVQLALAIAARIIHREVSLDRGLLVAMARVAIDRLGELASATIRLNPEDFAATSAAADGSWQSDQVRVVADPMVNRGGCLVQSDFGLMDVGIDAQFRELARAVLGERELDPLRPRDANGFTGS